MVAAVVRPSVEEEGLSSFISTALEACRTNKKSIDGGRGGKPLAVVMGGGSPRVPVLVEGKMRGVKTSLGITGMEHNGTTTCCLEGRQDEK